MSANKYPHLFEPIIVANTVFRNRIFASPTGSSYVDIQELPMPEIAAYYERKAIGGAASVAMGERAVDNKRGLNYGGNPIPVGDHRGTSFFRYVTNAISRHGASASIELQHGGCYAKRGADMGNQIYGPVEGLFIELIDAVIDAVNVKIEEGEVKAGGVKQDCVVYTIDPTDEQLIDVVLNVMKTLKDSKNLKALLVASAEMMDMDGEELHAQLVATISTALEEMEETTDEAVDSIPDVIKGDMLNIDVYVTKDLAILGMEVEVNTAGGEYDFETDEYTYVKETVNIFFASTKSGEDVGVELSITANDETISISGTPLRL